MSDSVRTRGRLQRTVLGHIIDEKAEFRVVSVHTNPALDQAAPEVHVARERPAGRQLPRAHLTRLAAPLSPAQQAYRRRHLQHCRRPPTSRQRHRGLDTSRLRPVPQPDQIHREDLHPDAYRNQWFGQHRTRQPPGEPDTRTASKAAPLHPIYTQPGATNCHQATWNRR